MGEGEVRVKQRDWELRGKGLQVRDEGYGTWDEGWKIWDEEWARGRNMGWGMRVEGWGTRDECWRVRGVGWRAKDEGWGLRVERGSTACDNLYKEVKGEHWTGEKDTFCPFHPSNTVYQLLWQPDNTIMSNWNICRLCFTKHFVTLSHVYGSSNK